MRYNVYSAMDDGEFSLWISTDQPEAEFEGEPGHTYKFFVYAADWAQNIEDKPAQHQAIITILPVYTVTFDVSNGNGTLSASVNGAAINSGDKVEEGSHVLFTATPDQGYDILNWSLNDEIIHDNTTVQFIHENLDADISVTVEFEMATGSLMADIENVKVFPNPFENSLTIQNTTDIQQVILMNITGQTMRVLDVNQEETITIQTEGFQPGLYLLRFIANDGSVITFKVSKM